LYELIELIIFDILSKIFQYNFLTFNRAQAIIFFFYIIVSFPLIDSKLNHLSQLIIFIYHLLPEL